MQSALMLIAIIGLLGNIILINANKTVLEKQKFLLDIINRIDNPLLFEDYIKYSTDFLFDTADYTQYDYLMELFQKANKDGYLLSRGQFFGAMEKSHMYQTWGLFNYFCYAKDFDTFMKVASWARMHVSEGMFVYALHMVVTHCDGFEGLMLPAINEILPQNFFYSKLIIEAKKFDYDTWSKDIISDNENSDLLYTHSDTNDSQTLTNNWKPWQWWKIMGLDEKWYELEKHILPDATFPNTTYDMHTFYMPTDYTRNLEYYNEQVKLSYLTEDVEWNAYWYYVNLDYAYFLNGSTYGFEKEQLGECLVYNLQTILARFHWELLSQGLGEASEYSEQSIYKQGYNPHLFGYNGHPQHGFDYESYGKYRPLSVFESYYRSVTKELGQYYSTRNDSAVLDLHQTEAIESYYRSVTKELGQYYSTRNDSAVLDLHQTEAIEIMENLMEDFGNLYNKRNDTYFSDENAQHLDPNIYLNFETMLRDAYIFKCSYDISKNMYEMPVHLELYDKGELLLPGVKIDNVEVSELVTYFDIVDYDISTLLNDRMVFVDGQFVLNNVLLARQQRLSHKPYTFDYSIESEKPQKVVIRAFLGPKFDQSKRSLSLVEDRENFIEIDVFPYQLAAGKNIINRNSQELYWGDDNRPTYTDLYKSVMMAVEGKQQFALNATQPHCGFPHRLLLPQGWEDGFPMQFFFFVVPYTGTEENFLSYDHTLYTCGICSAKRYIYDLPLGYPFDRPIEEEEFSVPNMLIKDVKVFHKAGFNFK